MDINRFGSEKILWEEDDFVIYMDYYVTIPRRPTATLWHRCTPQMTHGVYSPQRDPTCSHCYAVVPTALVGFYELVRYGRESAC